MQPREELMKGVSSTNKSVSLEKLYLGDLGYYLDGNGQWKCQGKQRNVDPHETQQEKKEADIRENLVL